MSNKHTNIAARVELLNNNQIARLATKLQTQKQYEEVLLLRETLRLANANARTLRTPRAKDAGNLAALP